MISTSHGRKERIESLVVSVVEMIERERKMLRWKEWNRKLKCWGETEALAQTSACCHRGGERQQHQMLVGVERWNREKGIGKE